MKNVSTPTTGPSLNLVVPCVYLLAFAGIFLLFYASLPLVSEFFLELKQASARILVN